MQWNPTDAGDEHPSTTKVESKRCFNALDHFDSGLDKETIQGDLKQESDLSLYHLSPEQSKCQPLEDLDANTQDSGYEGSKFHSFAQSLGVTPQSSWPVKRSFGSLDSMDEEFMEFTSMEQTDAQLPTDFNTLICGKLVHGSAEAQSPLSHMLLAEDTPNRIRTDLSKGRASKRPKAETKDSVLTRSVSASETSIKHALQLSSTEPDLIGDFSKGYCLPLTTGRHPDLKSITPETLAMLIRGEFEELLDTFQIIDCRFPYEFEGGHIDGALNLYLKDQILELLNENVKSSRHILIFHCEFSSERGPNLSRLLRNLDRIRNKDSYPALVYPEIYLLEGGYKNFYEQFRELCMPQTYKPMLHPEHQSDLRFFRAKSKSSNENRFHPGNRGNFKRLGFL